jgi:hypothetical protein
VFVELGAYEKNVHAYQGSGQHMKKGTNLKGKGALQGSACTCIMANWAAN